MKDITDEALVELLANLAMIDATGDTNGVPRLGIYGAEEALTMMIDFFTEEGGE
jgi:hypothetical protein